MRGAQTSRALRVLMNVRGGPIAARQLPAVSLCSRKDGLVPRRTFTTGTALRSAKEINKGASKLFDSADDAVADIKSGSTILSSGFGLCGVAGTHFPALPQTFDHETKDTS